MDLKEILSIISMFGLAAVGIRQVVELLAKPSSLFVRRSRERIKLAVLEALKEVETSNFLEGVKEALEEMLKEENPKLMQDMCQNIAIHDQKSQETFQEALKSVEEIKRLIKNLISLQQGLNDATLRLQEMQNMDNEAILKFYEKNFLDIYDAFKDDRRISAEQMYELEQIYNLYVARGGNSHIKKKMVLAHKWEVYN